MKFQTGFALHQESREKRYREKIIPPVGYGLLEQDAAGQEFRWMAECSGDDVMRSLCLPGEDPHSYMGSRIDTSWEYRGLIAAVQQEIKEAENVRKSGKVGNLCVAQGTMLLTDRGPCSIEYVKRTDLVWDGVEFVSHDGVVCSGVKPVIAYDGVTATPTHEVLVEGEWLKLDEAQRVGPIDRACQARSAVRIMDGLIRRAIREKCRTLRASTLRLWERTRREPEVYGDGSVGSVQSMCDASETYRFPTSDCDFPGRPSFAETCECLVSALQQQEGSILSQLWRPGDRMPVCFNQRWCRVHQTSLTSSNLSEAGHRSGEQQRTLRAWELALGYAQSEPQQPKETKVYDVTNCGPRNQFSANGKIVHNSLQYRTYPKRFCATARVDYGIDMTMAEATHIHSVYPRTYKGVPAYWNRQIQIVKNCGYCETLAGRRVKVEGNWAGSFGWAMGSTSINYRIQGTGADQKYLAMACLKDFMLGLGAIFAWDLHDGIYWYVPWENMDKAARGSKQILDNLPYQDAWGMTPSIPMPWDVKLGASWGTLHEWKEAA